MQPEPSKQAYDNNVNQATSGTGNVYPTNIPPPSYPGYAPQSGVYQPGAPGYYGQTPIYRQQGPVIVPVYRRWNYLTATPITSNLKLFFIFSGLLCLVWGLANIGLEIGIITSSSYTTYYRGIWGGGFLIGSGISMLIASCRTVYIMAYMIRAFTLTFFFIILGLILSIVNISTAYRCDRDDWYIYCDSELAYDLKIAILVVFILSTIHTIINMIVVSNAQKRTIASPA